MKHKFVAPCLFGIEKLVADELKDMGAENVLSENGRVLFEGELFMGVRANLRSRFAERIGLVIGEFEAKSFNGLFEGVNALPWEKYIEKEDAFPVKGWSLNSALFSIPDCQSIIKKAVVKRLSRQYKTDWFDEKGVKKQITFSILKNKVTIILDMSGEGLHKRGYRRNSNDAPIKETLAAAMVKLSRIFEDSFVYDPFCGSGTILIEAGLMAKNIAPGLRRSFLAEGYSFIGKEVWSEERGLALDMIKKDVPIKLFASDIDPECVALTMENARKAEVANCITAEVKDIKDFSPSSPRAVVITNPPYGERLLDKEKVFEIYKTMGKVFEKKAGYKYSVISPEEDFEKLFGRQADKRRKLYNGNIKCNLYSYYKF